MTAPRHLPAAAPRRVRERLAHAPDGRVGVVHRGPHALYVDIGGWCLGVVDSAAAQVPCALRTPSLAGVSGAHAAVRDGVLHLDGRPIAVGRLVSVAVPRLRRGGLGAVDHPITTRHWVEALVGAGDGLTPYGDDVLCGWLAVHRAAGVATPVVDTAVRALWHRTTLLSATLLDCAMHGEALPELAAWIAALGSPAEPGAAAALERIGHSSGRGLLAGGRQALAGLPATAVAA